MNGQHRTIKFTFEYSKDSVNFLDTTVVLDHHSDLIYTKLYTKPNDTAFYITAPLIATRVRAKDHLDNS